MGLNIAAYSHLKAIGHHDFDPQLNEGEPGPWCYYDHHLQALAYDEFPRSFRGIPVLGTMRTLSATFLDGGCYVPSEGTDECSFRAGSYTSYGDWRSALSDQFNPEVDPDGPFYELIWFADNEGTIGPEAAADLLADFREHADAYRGDEWSRDKYRDWTHAFELAAAGGGVWLK